MKTKVIAQSWVADTNSEILNNIHQKDTNISIYNRDVSMFEKETKNLLKRDLKLKCRGNIPTILNEVSEVLKPDEFHLILSDVERLLSFFKVVTKANNFQLFLATIDGNMCRKFHTDVNDLRMLCTYSGSGTLWLSEDNVNRSALNAYKDNESIVIDKNRIQQAETGAVIILKGSLYDKEAKGVVHRSPTIEENGEKRLLLRIDTNEFLKYVNN